MSSKIATPTSPAEAATTVAATAATLAPYASADSLSVQPLRAGDEQEALAFLAARPLHTVVMAGHIRDNGLESPLNRGQFHACRDGQGRLEGIALIGHATLVETRTEAALAAFARLAQSSPRAHMIMGEDERIERFWKYYASEGELPRRVCRELLFEQRWPIEALEPVNGLRLATTADLVPVMVVQAHMAYLESGVNPLDEDPCGFRLRCERRIEQGRVWVWVEDGRLIFKADVISETPQVLYLEGIYVEPLRRNRGYGSRCMSQLSRKLLARADALCVLVNERSPRACAFFEHAGFRLMSRYDTIFLERERAVADC